MTHVDDQSETTAGLTWTERLHAEDAAMGKRKRIKPIRLVRCDDCGRERDESVMTDMVICDLSVRICDDCAEDATRRRLRDELRGFYPAPSRDYRAERGSRS